MSIFLVKKKKANTPIADVIAKFEMNKMKSTVLSTTAKRKKLVVTSLNALEAAEQKFKLYMAVIIKAFLFKNFKNFSKHQKQHLQHLFKFIKMKIFILNYN
jgi:hypothetical protein